MKPSRIALGHDIAHKQRRLYVFHSDSAWVYNLPSESLHDSPSSPNNQPNPPPLVTEMSSPIVIPRSATSSRSSAGSSDLYVPVHKRATSSLSRATSPNGPGFRSLSGMLYHLVREPVYSHLHFKKIPIPGSTPRNSSYLSVPMRTMV